MGSVHSLADFPSGPEINTAKVQRYYKGKCADNQLCQRKIGVPVQCG